MSRSGTWIAVAAVALLTATCRVNVRPGDTEPVTGPAERATLAQVYYWKARPGMLEAYNRYIAEVAEPIDAEAKRHGAFVSVTTYMSRDTASAWTHMRVFLLRDSAQLRGLGAALDAAGARLQPDSLKRRQRGEYSATLRDRVGSALLEVVGK
jgi:hypothetical protein